MNVIDENDQVFYKNAEIIVFKEKYRQAFSTGNGWTTRPGYFF